MIKAGIDQDALITMFAEASAKQGEALRKAVSEATLRALQGRELTLDNIKKVVKNVAEAASAGIARNPAPRGRRRGPARQGARRHRFGAAAGGRGEPQGARAVRRAAASR